MKTLTAAMLFAFSALTLSSVTVAHDPIKKHSRDASAMLERMVEKLDLSEEKSIQLEEILARSHAEKRVIRKQTREKMRALKEEVMADLEQVLSEQELEKFKKMRKKKRRHVRKKHHCQSENDN